MFDAKTIAMRLTRFGTSGIAFVLLAAATDSLAADSPLADAAALEIGRAHV